MEEARTNGGQEEKGEPRISEKQRRTRMTQSESKKRNGELGVVVDWLHSIHPLINGIHVNLQVQPHEK